MDFDSHKYLNSEDGISTKTYFCFTVDLLILQYSLYFI